MKKRAVLALALVPVLAWVVYRTSDYAPGAFEERVAELRASGAKLDVEDFAASVERPPSRGVQKLAEIARRWREEHPKWVENVAARTGGLGESEFPFLVDHLDALPAAIDTLRPDIKSMRDALREPAPDLGGPAPPAFLRSRSLDYEVVAAVHAVCLEALACGYPTVTDEGARVHLRDGVLQLAFHSRLPYRSAHESPNLCMIRSIGLASLRAALLHERAWDPSVFARLDEVLALEAYPLAREGLLYERAHAVRQLSKPLPKNTGWRDALELRADAVAHWEFSEDVVEAYEQGPRAVMVLRSLVFEDDSPSERPDHQPAAYLEWEPGSEDNVGLLPWMRGQVFHVPYQAIVGDTRARLARVAVLVKRHVQEHGAFPESLADLGERLPPSDRLRHPYFGTEIELDVVGGVRADVSYEPPSPDDPILDLRWVDADDLPEPWRVVR